MDGLEFLKMADLREQTKVSTAQRAPKGYRRDVSGANRLASIFLRVPSLRGEQEPDQKEILLTPQVGWMALIARTHSVFSRAFSNSSPFRHSIIRGNPAASQPNAKPNRAMAASPTKSISGWYSSLGW